MKIDANFLAAFMLGMVCAWFLMIAKRQQPDGDNVHVLPKPSKRYA